MKKLIVALLLSIITQVHASGGCESFRIHIKNDTPATCYLIQRSVISGVIYKRQPYKIKPGTTVAQFEVTEHLHRPITVKLTYECANQQTITLISSKDRCYYANPGKVDGKVLKANNLTAVFSSKEGSFFSQQSGSILWTLS
jgi:hypothetical protein